MKNVKHFFFLLIASALLVSCTEDTETIVEKIVDTDISTNTTWVAGDTYIIQGDINIDNSILTIQPGTTIKFDAGASLSIGYYGAATIIANGTSDKPIIFSSTAASPTAGAWEGIFLYGYNSANSSFKFCQIKYAGTNDYGAINIDGTSCTFSNNTIQYAKKLGVRFVDADAFCSEMNNNTISDNGGHAIRIAAAQVDKIGTGNTFTLSDNFGVNVWGTTVSGTVTWKNLDKPYYIEGDIMVDNASLTIEPGTILKFDVTSSFSLGYYNTATLIANGTTTSNIVFTSSAISPTAGAWDGIYFYSHNQTNSSMTYCEVAYAGKTNNQAINVDNTSLTFTNNNVHHSSGFGIDLETDGSFVAMNNNTINNCANHAIQINTKYLHTLGTGNTITSAEGFGIYLTDGTVDAVATWRKQTVPVYINNEIDIENTLTIEAGSIFKFGASGSIFIGYYNVAQVNAIGTSANPIVFTAISTTPAAGAWEGITFYSNTSSNTTLDYCEFRYAGKGTTATRAAVYLDRVPSMTIKNCKFMDSNGWGIYKYSTTLSAESINNTFTNCSLGQMGTN